MAEELVKMQEESSIRQEQAMAEKRQLKNRFKPNKDNGERKGRDRAGNHLS